jgi:hypothetical protein
LPDRLAEILVGGGSHRAAIQDDQFGRSRVLHRAKAAMGQLSLNGGPISLGSAAAEILEKKSRHSYSHFTSRPQVFPSQVSTASGR